ncbi:MAG: efflux RND transporter periplasmic adaptor subunit, partial [Desulfosalsimonas sp.]
MNKPFRITVHVLLALAVLAAGFAGFFILKSFRKPPERQQVEKPLPIVRTVPVTIKDRKVSVRADGTVVPLAETKIVPQVAGKVVHVSGKLVNGGVFEKGELMVQIEPDDYEIGLILARAGVLDAESSYQTALEESRAAVREWEKMNPGSEPSDLAAGKPRLKAAYARRQAREADLEKARLELDRTRIYAPFDCRVSQEQVDEGQYVSPGQSLATVYLTRAVEIVVPVESTDLEWIDVPGFTTGGAKGSPAGIFADVAGTRQTWQGEVVRANGKIDENTRMVNLVIRVPDPHESLPPLLPGQYAEVEISGRSIQD